MPLVNGIGEARDRSPRSALNVLLLAEGFTAEDEPTFLRRCYELPAALRGISPFGHLAYRAHNRVLFWHHFTPSAVAGPSVDPDPRDTVYRSTYDPVSGALKVDGTRVQGMLQTLQVPDPQSGETWPAFGFGIRFPGIGSWPAGVAVVLLPDSVDGNPISGEFDAERLPGWPAWYIDEAVIATTVDRGWHRVVARALARAFGLGDEFTEEGPQWEEPADWIIKRLNASYPNLFAGAPPSAPVPPEFKWYSELDAGSRSAGLTVVPSGAVSPTPDEPIQLFEGAGGFRRGAYRSSANCLMRAPIGEIVSSGIPPASALKSGQQAFCTLCQRHLTRVLTGTTSRPRKRTLDNQTLEFDDVNWGANATKFTEGFPITSSARGPTPHGSPYWEYDATVEAPEGLIIQALKLRDHGGHMSGETVADLIEFRDLAVTFVGEGGGEEVVNFFEGTTSLNDVESTFISAIDGDAPQLGAKPLRGLKLAIRKSFPGRCTVLLELSLVLKGEAHDIDPGQNVIAAKFFPQIGFTWFPENATRVSAFRGCVRMVCSNTGTGHAPGNVHPAMPGETVAAFFTDTNNILSWDVLTPFLGRRIDPVCVQLDPDGPPPPLFGVLPLAWSVVFDYHRPDIRQEIEIPAVYGPKASLDKRKGRVENYTWPPGSSRTLMLEKYPRQAYYDNIHLHASMGPDPISGTALVHAPGCAEACTHLHWRWGTLSNGIPLVTQNWDNFRGWSDIEAHSEDGAPLIPPNQDLNVALTLPDKDRESTDAVVTQANARPIMHGDQKAIWYTVDISDPEPGARQVILEQGISYSYEYNWPNLGILLFLTACYLEQAGKPIPHPLAQMETLRWLYALIRWFRDNPPVSQIPVGDYSKDGVSMEEM